MVHGVPARLTAGIVGPWSTSRSGLTPRSGFGSVLAAIGAEARLYDAHAERGASFTTENASQHRLVIFSPGFPPMI